MYSANISCVLLSLTSMAGQTSHILLAYVIPCINKASAIYSMHIFMHAIHVRVLRTVPICTELVSVTETSICRFYLLSRSRVDLSSSSL